MELRFINVIILAIIFIATAYCQLPEMKDIVFPSSKRYCGSHLAQALSTICRGYYNTIYKKNQRVQKRAQWSSQYASESSSESSSQVVQYPYRKKTEATSMLGSYTRRKRYGRGVYNECCEKSCTREELSSYCAVPYTGRR